MDDGGKAASEVMALLNVVKSLQDVKASGDASRMKNELTEPMLRSTVTTQELSHSPLENLPSVSDIRRILAPLIASNAQARVESSALGKDTLSAEPQGGIQGLLTDEICDRFAEQMRVVEEGEEFSSSNGLSSMNDRKIPKAPRAMLMSGTVRGSGDVLRKQDRNKSSNTKSPKPNLRIPIAIPLSTTPANAQEAASPVPFSTPADEGIAVPLDSKFFTHSKEREEGEIMGSSSPSSRTPPYSVRKTSPLKRYYTSGRKYPISPGPIRHRLPMSRTYRSRSPSEVTSYRRTSRSSRSPQPFRRSQSPTYTRRPSSFSDDLGGPSSSPERMRQLGRRRSSPTIPRPSRPTSPISLRSATHQRRGSDYDTRLGKNESYSWKDNGYPDKGAMSLASEDENYAHSFSFNALDHHTSDHVRRRSSTQGREFDAKSTRPKIPTRSRSHSKPPPGGQSNVVDTKLTTSPLSMMTPLPGTMECESPPHDQVQVVKPCHEVPGLWMIKTGGSSVEIVTCEFDIDRVTADMWGIGPSRHGEEKARNTLSLSLVCIPLSDGAVRAKLDVMSATRQEIMNEITRIETVWPPAGHLVIEINPDHDWGRSWLPRHLGKDHASIDITPHVHEGMNIIRLIQLASLADCMFVVLAKEKPPDVDAKDLEQAEMEVDEPQTTEQLLAFFRTSTRIIYS